MFQSTEFNTFTPLVELIAKHFNMTLAGKCLLSAFEDHLLHEKFKETTTALDVKEPGRYFLSQLTKEISLAGIKPNWRLYYSLLQKFDIPKERPEYFNKNFDPKQEAIGSTIVTPRTTGKEPIFKNPLDPIHLRAGFKTIGRVMAESHLIQEALNPIETHSITNGQTEFSSFSEDDNMRNPHQRWCDQPENQRQDFHKLRNKEGRSEKKYFEGDMYTRQGYGDVRLKTIRSHNQHDFHRPTPSTPWQSPTQPRLTAQEIADEIHNWERILKSKWLAEREKVLGSKREEINSFIAKLMEQLRTYPKDEQDSIV